MANYTSTHTGTQIDAAVTKTAGIGDITALTTTEKSNLVGAVNEVNGLVSTHKAETTAYASYVTRDLSVAGVQTVTGIPFAAKKVTFKANLDGTMIHSNGVSVGTTQHQALAVANTGNTVGNAAQSIVLAGATWTVYGKVTAINDTSFQITWSVAAGTPVGTALILFEAETH